MKSRVVYLMLLMTGKCGIHISSNSNYFYLLQHYFHNCLHSEVSDAIQFIILTMRIHVYIYLLLSLTDLLEQNMYAYFIF